MVPAMNLMELGMLEREYWRFLMVDYGRAISISIGDATGAYCYTRLMARSALDYLGRD